MPLYRHEKQLARWGAEMSRSTLCEWIRIAAEWLEPIYGEMLRRLLDGGYVQADDVARQRGEGLAVGVAPERSEGVSGAGGEANKRRSSARTRIRRGWASPRLLVGRHAP